MQVYKAFFKIVRKRLNTVLIYFIVFIGIAVALAVTGKENAVTGFEATSLAIAIENLDRGELGAALIEQLGVNNEISAVPESEDALIDAMFSRSLDYVLYIPADFTERFLAGERENLLSDEKVPSSTTGMFADNQIESYLMTVGMYTDAGYDIKESIANAGEAMTKDAVVEFANGKDEAAKDPASYYFQYLPYIFVCTMVCTLGPVLMVFNKRDISARNKCSAMSFSKRNLYLLLGSFILMAAAYGLIMFIGYLIYPEFIGSIRGLFSMINALIMILLSMALAYLAAQIARRETGLDMFSNVVGLGLAFLGGVFVPLDIFGENVLKVSRFIPTYWYVTANDAIQSITRFGNVPAAVTRGFLVQSIYVITILFAGMLINRMKARES